MNVEDYCLQVFYQTLLGTWPTSGLDSIKTKRKEGEGSKEDFTWLFGSLLGSHYTRYVERIRVYLLEAVKVETSSYITVSTVSSP